MGGVEVGGGTRWSEMLWGLLCFLASYGCRMSKRLPVETHWRVLSPSLGPGVPILRWDFAGCDVVLVGTLSSGGRCWCARFCGGLGCSGGARSCQMIHLAIDDRWNWDWTLVWESLILYMLGVLSRAHLATYEKLVCDTWILYTLGEPATT